MKNIALDFNIVLMAIAHCQINIASEGLLLVGSCLSSVLQCSRRRRHRHHCLVLLSVSRVCSM